MALFDWFKRRRTGPSGVGVEILEVAPLTEPCGQLIAKVAMISTSVAAVGLKCRLISMPKEETAEGEEICHGEMNDLVEAVIEANARFDTTVEFPYDLRSWLEQQGGVLSLASQLVDKVAETFSSTESAREFFLEVQCNVGEHWETPCDRKPVLVAIEKLEPTARPDQEPSN